MRNTVIIIFISIFVQAIACTTVMYFLNHLELICLVDQTTGMTMTEEEETHEEASSDFEEIIFPVYPLIITSDSGYFNEQDYQLLPGFTDRIFSPPEFMC